MHSLPEFEGACRRGTFLQLYGDFCKCGRLLGYLRFGFLQKLDGRVCVALGGRRSGFLHKFLPSGAERGGSQTGLDQKAFTGGKLGFHTAVDVGGGTPNLSLGRRWDKGKQRELHPERQ